MDNAPKVTRVIVFDTQEAARAAYRNWYNKEEMRTAAIPTLAHDQPVPAELPVGAYTFSVLVDPMISGKLTRDFLGTDFFSAYAHEALLRGECVSVPVPVGVPYSDYVTRLAWARVYGDAYWTEFFNKFNNKDKKEEY